MNTKWYISSTGEGLSLTIKGALIGLIPLFIFIGQQFHVSLTQEYLMQGIQLGFELVTAAVVVVGAARKVYYWIKELVK